MKIASLSSFALAVAIMTIPIGVAAAVDGVVSINIAYSEMMHEKLLSLLKNNYECGSLLEELCETDDTITVNKNDPEGFLVPYGGLVGVGNCFKVYHKDVDARSACGGEFWALFSTANIPLETAVFGADAPQDEEGGIHHSWYVRGRNASVSIGVVLGFVVVAAAVVAVVKRKRGSKIEDGKKEKISLSEQEAGHEMPVRSNAKRRHSIVTDDEALQMV